MGCRGAARRDHGDLVRRHVAEVREGDPGLEPPPGIEQLEWTPPVLGRGDLGIDLLVALRAPREPVPHRDLAERREGLGCVAVHSGRADGDGDASILRAGAECADDRLGAAGRDVGVVAGRAADEDERAPSSRAALATACAMPTSSQPAGQVRWWSATVVTPQSSASARPTRAAACASSGSTPTRAYAAAIVGSHSRIGTCRVPGRVRNAHCSRWWWAFTSPGATRQPSASMVRAGGSMLPAGVVPPGTMAITSPPAHHRSAPSTSRVPVQIARAPRTRTLPMVTGSGTRRWRSRRAARRRCALPAPHAPGRARRWRGWGSPIAPVGEMSSLHQPNGTVPPNFTCSRSSISSGIARTARSCRRRGRGAG